MSSNVVGRAQVVIDTDVDDGQVTNAAADIDQILTSGARDTADTMTTEFGKVAFPTELAEGFSDKLDAIGGTVREFGGGFGDLVTGMETFGLTAEVAGIDVVDAFEKIEAGSQLVGGAIDIFNAGKAGLTALSSATNLAAGAQAALNAVMALNPIVLVVVAIAALVAAFVIAYNKSETFRAIVDKAFQAIKTTITSVVNTVRRVVSTVFGWMRTYLSTVFNAYKTIAMAAFNAIRSVITTVVNAVRSVVSGGFAGIRTTITSVLSSVRNAVSSAFASIRTGITNAVRTARTAVTTAFNGIKTGVTTAISSVVSTVSGLPGKITGALGDMGELLLSAGGRVIDGLVSGITGGASRVADAISGVVGNITDFLPFSPAKRGPLSGRGDPALAGARIAAMLADGMASNLGPVQAASSAMAGAAAVGQVAGGVTVARSTGGVGQSGAVGVGATGTAATITQQFYGPQTGREVTREMEWAMRFAS